MHCQTCGAAHRGRGRLCDECQKTLSGLSNAKTRPSLADGFKAGQEATAAPQAPEPSAREGIWGQPALMRTHVVPIALRGRSLKRNWLMGIGAAGLVIMLGNLAYRWNTEWFWLLVPSGLAFYMGYSLMRRAFFRLAGLVNFESDQAGRVYFTVLRGDCTVCNGEVGLKEVGPKGDTKTVIQCKADARHQWAFDPQRLEKL